MSSYLSSAGQGVTNLGTGVGKGVGEIGKGVGKGVGEIGKGVGIGGGSSEGQRQAPKEDTTTNPSQPAHNDSEKPQPPPQSEGGGIAGALNSLGGSATKGLGAVGDAGMQIGGTLSKATLDLNKNVAKGVGTVGGTAVDAVVNIATSTTDTVLSPIANSLKAIEGLEKLGEGVESINGISTKVLQGVADAAKTALHTAGKTPTFFDSDGDGIVTLSNTTAGFIALGLDPKYAKIAAWSLHSTFSYPTSDSWNPTSLLLPSSGYEFPVKVENMDKTKWGRNWGNFERVEWVRDVDVERFFGVKERTTWGDYFVDIKSYFGTALLIFEWGTTWPYVQVPGSQIVAGQIGTVLRTVILPTIVKTHEKEKGEEPGENKTDDSKGGRKMPTPPPIEPQKEQKEDSDKKDPIALSL